MPSSAVCLAINNRRILEFTYDGRARRVEPHCYGKTRKREEQLLAWEVCEPGGTARPGWKTFRVAGMAGIAVARDGFEGARDGYVTGQNAMAEVFAQL